MRFSRYKNFLIVLTIVTVLTAGISFVAKNNVYAPDQVVATTDIKSDEKNILTPNEISSSEEEKIPDLPPPQKLANPPKIIKAVYMTGYSAGSKTYISYLDSILKTTEINAVIIDIKGSSGYISYNSDIEDAKTYGLNSNAISDIDSLVRFLHGQNIYVIGRIAVFEDPLYSKARPDIAIYNKEKTTDVLNPVLWRDNNNLSWLDPASKDGWDYNISVAKDALENHGFDEVNFDYIRFPSDGNMENLGFPIWDQKTPKYEIIKEFFKYLREQLKDEKISADLFGQTTINKDDMGIGQVIEDALEYFDYVSPMVYPSHYINGFIGFQNPAEHPYEVVKYSMDGAKNRKSAYLDAKKNIVLENSEASGTPADSFCQTSDCSFYVTPLAELRPWLQDFDMGADYNAFMVKQQITATQDALGSDFNGYMLWNPSNIYTKGAIELVK